VALSVVPGRRTCLQRQRNPRATVCFWREQADTAWRAGAAEPLPEGIVSLLNPQVDISGLAEDLAQAGYPVQD
jgi:hypothetical protein